MNNRRNKLNRKMCACLVLLVCGLGGFAPRANAQTVASLVATRSTIGGPSTSEGGGRGNAELQERVAAALHAQPYFDDRHIDVSVRGGAVILSGIVFSDWDLQDALRTARKAAGGRRVVDSLSIEEGGR
jgi:osmotically-inducible protein OsmY